MKLKNYSGKKKRIVKFSFIPWSKLQWKLQPAKLTLKKRINSSALYCIHKSGPTKIG